jgi:hypothetical protein
VQRRDPLVSLHNKAMNGGGGSGAVVCSGATRWPLSCSLHNKAVRLVVAVEVVCSGVEGARAARRFNAHSSPPKAQA